MRLDLAGDPAPAGNPDLASDLDLGSDLDLASDNVAGASSAIVEALARVNRGTASPYGQDEETVRLARMLADVFETECTVVPVASGTAANALALGAVTHAHEAIACTDCAHILTSECGAPEFFTGGAKVVPLATEGGKLCPRALEAALADARAHGVHQSQFAALSLTQATEWGTVYRPDEIASLAAIARHRGLPVHMDGARFANALVSLGVSPADATWRAGVDILSFGATKNGAIAAEAVVVFRPELARSLAARRKQSGHLWSKGRFLSAQLVAYLEHDLWLANARRANLAARMLGEGLMARPGVSLLHPIEANEIFACMPHALADRMEQAGIGFYRWSATDTQVVIRMVASFATADRDVARVLGALGEKGNGLRPLTPSKA